MRIVIAHHIGNETNYVWEVPPHIEKIKVDDMLYTETDQIVIAKTGIIEGEGAVDVAKMNGARFPLKKVTKIIERKLYNYIKRQAISEVIYQLNTTELPF